MNSRLLPLYVLILISLDFSQLRAQSDCCGMGDIFSSILGSGIFGGYGFQQFGAEGLNDLISQNLESEGISYDDFGFGWGWMAGANLIQIRENDLLFGLKFYYQSISQSQKMSGTYQGEEATQTLEVNINTWSFGLGMSYIINDNLDFRILDAYMTFPSAKFTNKISSASTSFEDEYESTESNIGFTFDTGLVYYPLPPYLSLEVVGGYSFFTFGTLETAEGSLLSSTSDIIDSGGFFASAILTVGIPFN